MYHDYLMNARHEERLRAAAKHRLAVQARRARAAHRRGAEPAPIRRLRRALHRPVPA